MIAETRVLRDLSSLAVKRAEQRIIGGSPMMLEPGQLLTSQRQLAERWGWSHKRVRTVLAVLARYGFIHIEVIGRGPRPATRITVTRVTSSRSPRSGHSRAHKGTVGHSSQVATQAELAFSAASRVPTLGPPTPPVLPVVQDLDAKTVVVVGGERGAERAGADREQRTVATTPTSTAMLTVTVPHERYAAELVQVLNDAQRGNPRIEGDTFTPISAAQLSVREAALAMLNAGVPLEYAKQAARMAGAIFKPTVQCRQILSLAYVRKSVIRDWIRSRATQEVRARGGVASARGGRRGEHRCTNAPQSEERRGHVLPRGASATSPEPTQCRPAGRVERHREYTPPSVPPQAESDSRPRVRSSQRGHAVPVSELVADVLASVTPTPFSRSLT